jgi:hypothetical protein
MLDSHCCRPVFSAGNLMLHAEVQGRLQHPPSAGDVMEVQEEWTGWCPGEYDSGQQVRWWASSGRQDEKKKRRWWWLRSIISFLGFGEVLG